MTESKNTPAQRSLNVLLVGDSCVDEYRIGTIDRLSPEAPVPVIKVVETTTVPGMASNVRKNLENLGCRVRFVTNSETILKTRYIDQRSRQHMMRVDSEPEIQPWDGRFTDSNSDYDAVVVSDYNKGFLSAEQIHELIRFSDCPVFIDTKKRDLELFDMPDTYVKINELEHSMVTSQHPNLIVTLGSRGAMYNEKVYPTKSVEVADVCGAGDTFLAALTVEYLLTNDIEKAILFANAASGVTVQHRGNYAPTYKEITDNE